MEMSVQAEESFYVISVKEPRIDAATALNFKEEVRRHSQNAPTRVVLDLTQVNFIDSSGLGAIVATMKHLSPDRKLVLAGLTPAVEKVFQLTRMDSVFDIFLNLDDALQVNRV